MYYYIANPAAGSGAVEDIQPKLRNQLKKFDPNPNLNKTTGEGDAKRLVKKALAEGYKTIVAIGGDTTVREVITAVYEQQAFQVAVGIVPIGKNNTLANRLGINDWQQACSILANRRLNSFNLLEINTQLYFDECRLGLPSGKAFNYKLVLDKTTTVKGTATELAMYNQKLHSNQLDNVLQLTINPHSNNDWFSSIKYVFQKTPVPYSQFSFKQLSVSSSVKLRAEGDGQKLTTANELSIQASEHPLLLITDRAL